MQTGRICVIICMFEITDQGGPMSIVSLVPCRDYSHDEISRALDNLLESLGGLDFVTPGMKIAIKANLVTFMSPDKAATTHPALLCELTRRLVGRGAQVVVGDSPGGLYNAAFVGRVYNATGMNEIEECGGSLNRDFSQRDVIFPDARAAHSFTYTSYLDNADVIINFSKLKSHGMMGLSCAVKNMFGVIPGTMKPEYHYRYPDHAVFADMIIDLNEYFLPKTVLCICDAVVGMEGNGPTAGEPRQIGALLASASPYCLDIVAAEIVGLTRQNIPTLESAYLRGLAPADADGVEIVGNIDAIRVPDYKKVLSHSSLEFKSFLGGRAGALVGSAIGGLLRARPKAVRRECVGCGVCANICPAHAITISDGYAVVDRNTCIRCFCCQEFCPKGAMKVHRTPVARLLVHNTKSQK